MKKVIAIVMSVVMLLGLVACGKEAEKKIEGDLVTVINQIYENLELDAETKEAFSYHEIGVITEDFEEYLLGTADLEYAEAAYAMPMMSAVAYQLNIFRLDESADVEVFKAQAEAAFDTGKWVCVMPEKVATVNVGNVVLFVAGTEQVVDAVVAAFEGLAQ